MATSHSGLRGFFLLALLLGLSVALLPIVRTKTIAPPRLSDIIVGQHAVQRHGQEAIVVREAVQNNLCRNRSAYYSAKLGQFMFLCHLSGNDDWAGWVVAVDAHEITAFVSSWSYWSGVIRRDKYFPIPLP